MERAKGNMVVLRLERKIMPDYARPLGNFKCFVFAIIMMESHRGVLARETHDLTFI